MTYCLPLPYPHNPEDIFVRLKHLPDFIWLDSGRPQSMQGRFDVFTALAYSQAQVNADGQTKVDGKQSPKTLAEWLNEHTQTPHHTHKHLPFTGGVIGYFGYHWQDTHFGLTQVGSITAKNTTNPVVALGAYNWALIIDHHTHECTLAANNINNPAIATVKKALQSPPQATAAFTCAPFTHDTQQSEYLESLARIHNYIVAGDCYQVNYSQRFSSRFTGSLDTAYLKLRQATPSPFGAYIKRPNHSILSASPERFLQIKGQQVLSQPIKGSSPRGQNPVHDQQLAQSLLKSAKNRAENVMIVDLLRNDLSQCCKPFSVKVPHLCELHTFANVHHLISTVTGELKESFSAFDLFTRSFPGGSITGAPKKRAMQIIQELEKSPRGIYCGSVAYFSNNGNTDSSITIRTLEAKDNQLYCWGGGGVVIDSIAEEEYQESLFKVRKLMMALCQ